MNCVGVLRLVDGEDRLERLDVDVDRLLRRADRLARLGGDDDDRLSDEHDHVLGQQHFVLNDRAEDVVGEVVMREERDDARNVARAASRSTERMRPCATGDQ